MMKERTQEVIVKIIAILLYLPLLAGITIGIYFTISASNLKFIISYSIIGALVAIILFTITSLVSVRADENTSN